MNGPKSNNYVLVGIWLIVCVQKPFHHFFADLSSTTFVDCVPPWFTLSETVVSILSAKADQRKCLPH